MTDHAPTPALLAKAETLTEALPYIQRYAGATFVIKYGGHAMGDPELARDFAEDVVLLKAVGINPVVVHGGGPQIGAMLKRLGVESQFVGGLRVTDAATAEVAEMVLAGKINKEIVAWIDAAGGRAVGISGKDARLVVAEKVRRTEPDRNSGIERHVDLGFVGDPVAVDPMILKTLARENVIPVVAPVALGIDGHTYNINADTMAGAIAAALGASRFFLLTDVAGVLDKSGDRSRSRAHRRAEGRRYDLRRNDPQGRDVRRRGRGGGGCRGHPRRADPARDAARDIHPPGRGNARPAIAPMVSQPAAID
jgi:acetylglutamate kinase